LLFLAHEIVKLRVNSNKNTILRLDSSFFFIILFSHIALYFRYIKPV